ncbi:MAG: hypothetical protein U1A25_02850 [Candidatus Sungbacteria bacterium]|nr:hypothetical protein [bacterium]MDZ4260581.1 hypothetical protein [Candidatus Sungbacteria bacterium]
MDRDKLIAILSDLKHENVHVSGYMDMDDKERTFIYEIMLADGLDRIRVHYEILDADWGEAEESISFYVPLQEISNLADLKQRIRDNMLSVMSSDSDEK